MSGCCGQGMTFEGLSSDYKRRLWLVIAINATMFLVEMGAGALAGSQALQADALDFLGDATTYGISLAVIGTSIQIRARAAILKALSLSAMALWVLGSTAYHVLILGVPRAEIMGAIGLLALVANAASVLILMRYKDGDANVRSVWLCSRNDAIGNIAVMIAALAVWGTASKWPDLLVGDNGRSVLDFFYADFSAILQGNARRAPHIVRVAYHQSSASIMSRLLRGQENHTKRLGARFSPAARASA
jgi:Co/Zn/Cd efflux system component